jgi:hypothetical protein
LDPSWTNKRFKENKMNYDVIGDVHGQFEKLTALLQHLGYRESNGAWRHADRTAIFVGDLIDRGPRQVATVELVRRMVEAGTARCILGNHEFNAIAWATPDTENPGEHLRRHGRAGNRKQHADFLAEVEETPLHAELIAWFKTLPLWLDLDQIRIVHACWNDSCMDQLRPYLGPDQTLTDELIRSSNQKGHWAHDAVEVLCKGLEVELPKGALYHDKDGKARTATRIRWWEPDLSTYRKAALATQDILELIPDTPMPNDDRVKPYTGIPVFFGHYWRDDQPMVIAPNMACLDFSAAKGCPLVAYRWEGEARLATERFVWL